MSEWVPLGASYRVRLSRHAERTLSGIWLPESMVRSASEGEVAAVGPGEEWHGRRSVMEAGVGERVLFEEHALQPVGDGSEGLLREEDLAAVVVLRDEGRGMRDEGEARDEGRGMRDEESQSRLSSLIPHPSSLPLQPCGEWLLVETAGRVTEESGLAVPEAYRKRPRCGRVVDAGLGQMRRKGLLAGTRTPLAAVLGVIPPVEGLLVYWEKRARMLAVAGSGRLLLVRVGDVLAVEEEENDNGNFVERGGPDRAVAGVAVEGDFGRDGHQ